jgi:hypothetical protein
VHRELWLGLELLLGLHQDGRLRDQETRQLARSMIVAWPPGPDREEAVAWCLEAFPPQPEDYDL